MRLNLLDDIPLNPDLVALFDSVSGLKPDAQRSESRLPKVLPTLSLLEMNSSNTELAEMVFSFYLKAPVLRKLNIKSESEFRKLFAFVYLEMIFTEDPSESALFSLISMIRKLSGSEKVSEADAKSHRPASCQTLLQFLKLLYILKRNQYKKGCKAFEAQFSSFLETLLGVSGEFENCLISLTQLMLEDHKRNYKECRRGDEIPFLYELTALAQHQEINVDFNYLSQSEKGMACQLLKFSSPKAIFPLQMTFFISGDLAVFGYTVEFAKLSYQKCYIENESYDFAHLKGFQELLRKNASNEEASGLNTDSRKVQGNQKEFVARLIELVESLNTSLWEMKASQKEGNSSLEKQREAENGAKLEEDISISVVTSVVGRALANNNGATDELQVDSKELEENKKELVDLRKIIINLERENMRLRESLEDIRTGERVELNAEAVKQSSTGGRSSGAPKQNIAVEQNAGAVSKSSTVSKKAVQEGQSASGADKLLEILLSNGSNKADVEHLTRQLESENTKLRRLLNDRGKAMLEKERVMRETLKENQTLYQESNFFFA